MKPFKGRVLSVKMAETAIVAVERIKIHPLYKKRTKQVTKYHVHDGIGVNVGELVEFKAIKPISKTKKWAIEKVIRK